MGVVLVVQHLEPEGPYAVGAALAAAGLEIDVRRTDLGDPLPETTGDVAAVVVMGGPMAAHDDDGFPTRRAEVELLEDALARATPTLGICLGAQLLAVAAGGDARPGDGLEVGWGDVGLTIDAATDPLLQGAPSTFPVLHWHGDEIVLPPGAVHLARSPRYAVQAFRCGPAAWGLQFHPEVDEVAVARFLRAFPDDTGDPGAILAGSGAALAAMGPVRDDVLARFAVLATRHRSTR